MLKLGVNVDHVATLRQARLTHYPDPVDAALAAERAGASAITVHLREDRRHIQDADLFRIREAIGIELNQELAPVPEMVEIAAELRPDEVCFVPERREELTTEGGLDVSGLKDRLAPAINRLKMAGVAISLFVDPDPHQVEAAAMLGADFVELHTGRYATLADADIVAAAQRLRGGGSDGNARSARAAGLRSKAMPQLGESAREELKKIADAVKLARSLKLKANVGHGLNYQNAAPVAAIAGVTWAHIGHAIVGRAVMVGMGRAVREMIALLNPRIGRRAVTARSRSTVAHR